MQKSVSGYLGTQHDVIGGRVIAFIIDHILSLILATVPGFVAAVATESTFIIYPVFFATVFGYFTILEGLYGQTAGKRLVGVIVVSSDGSPVTFRQALSRNLWRLIDGLFSYAVGLVVMLVSEDRQRIGDHAAGTLVVRRKREGHDTDNQQNQFGDSEGTTGQNSGSRRKDPSHVCQSCGEKYYSDPLSEISTCRNCGGIKVEKQ
ncbi:RDD family protein [Halosimplex marinum]|uniref:RDD family protein n=1 Tax=Halosimplex marinum TaxID=3396620 RepID=UPI003F55EED9